MDTVAGRRPQHPGFTLDGDTGIVRDLLPATGEGVEQSRLAAIRRPDQREVSSADLGHRAHAHRSDATTRIAIASRRLRAMVVSLTRTAMGSRPNGPSCRTSMS